LPAWHDPCGALRSKTGLHSCFFASARPQRGRERRACRWPRRWARRSAQAARLRKSSPYSGVGCAGSDLLCDVQDDWRSGISLRSRCTIVRRSRGRGLLGVNFRTCRLMFDIALGLSTFPIHFSRGVQTGMPIRALMLALFPYSGFNTFSLRAQVVSGAGNIFADVAHVRFFVRRVASEV
jgi:hypothetical protein